MIDETHGPRISRSSAGHASAAATGAPLSLASGVCLLMAAGTAIFLAGGPPQGSLGIFLMCVGLVLIVRPPQTKVDWRLWIASVALVACGALAFLPERWFAVPGWRSTLESIPVIHLPSSVSVVPRETAFWLAILAISALTGLFVLSQPIRSSGLLVLAVLAASLCATYAGLAIYAKQTGWHYPFASTASFGFFPNRNHTATFLITGSILAMGVLSVVVRDGRWLLGILAAGELTTCVTALFFFSGSRGGIVFLFVGTLVWVAGLGRTHLNPRLLISVVVLMVAGALLFLVAGGEARNRLLASIGQKPSAKPPAVMASALRQADTDKAAGEVQEEGFKFRLLIYRDALDLIHDFPLTGTGLGAFAPDFAQYRKASFSEMATIHPESDWLMLTAEAGIPALCCVLILLWLLVRRLPTLRAHPFWPLRWGCVAAAAAAILHGVVDVPAHRVALGWWIVLLAAFGFQIYRGKDAQRSRVQQALFVLGGLGSMVLGWQLIRAEWLGGPPLPPFVAAKAENEILAQFNRGEIEAAMNTARQAVSVSPTASPLYFQLGVLLLHFEDTDAEVDEIFRAQRLLTPIWPRIPLDQGDAWITVDPKRCATLWIQALGLIRRTNQVRHAPDNTIDYFRNLLVRSQQWPAVQSELVPVAAQSPAYAIAWLHYVTSGDALKQIEHLMTDVDLVRRFSGDERQEFLLLWYAKGDRVALTRFVAIHSDWQPAMWTVHLQELEDAQQFEQIVHEAAEHYHVSLALPGDSRVNVVSSGDDIISRFQKYWAAGNTVAARRVLSEASGMESRSNAAEFWRLKAALAAQDQAWDIAWKDFKQYLRQSDSPDVIP